MLEAGERATARGWEMSKEANDEKVEVLRENGITVTEASPEIQAALEEVGQEMMDEWRKEASAEEQEVLDEYLRLKEEHENSDASADAVS